MFLAGMLADILIPSPAECRSSAIKRRRPAICLRTHTGLGCWDGRGARWAIQEALEASDCGRRTVAANRPLKANSRKLALGKRYVAQLYAGLLGGFRCWPKSPVRLHIGLDLKFKKRTNA